MSGSDPISEVFSKYGQLREELDDLDRENLRLRNAQNENEAARNRVRKAMSSEREKLARYLDISIPKAGV